MVTDPELTASRRRVAGRSPAEQHSAVLVTAQRVYARDSWSCQVCDLLVEVKAPCDSRVPRTTKSSASPPEMASEAQDIDGGDGGASISPSTTRISNLRTARVRRFASLIHGSSPEIPCLDQWIKSHGTPCPLCIVGRRVMPNQIQLDPIAVVIRFSWYRLTPCGHGSGAVGQSFMLPSPLGRSGSGSVCGKKTIRTC